MSKINLFEINIFVYHDKPRKVFVTEENDTLVGGYEVLVTNPETLAYFRGLTEAFQLKDEKWIKFLISNMNGIWSFKKFSKEKIR